MPTVRCDAMTPASRRTPPRVAHLSVVHHVQDPRIARREGPALRDAGFEVHQVMPHDRDETRRGIRVHALAPAEGRCRRVIRWGTLFEKARALDADLYHFHDPELIPVAYLLKRWTGAPVIYDMHENYRAGRGLEGRLLRLLERFCFRWVDHVVISDASYAQVTEPSRAPTTLVANYFKPPDPPVSAEKDDAPLRLVYTGVLAGTRGLFAMLDLADRIKQAGRDWRLDVAGVCYRDEDRRRAEQQMRRRELGAVVERTAWDRFVPWRALMQRTARAHVGLALFHDNPNAAGAILTKFYEYLHYGLPILCSDFPLWRRFVERHDCGAVVPPGDAGAAFAVLDRWAEDPARYRRLSENARAAASQYQWPGMARRLVRLYDQLLGTSRPPLIE
jgi:glycosyltransferase involved in cell wall biosynthesis